MALKNTWMKTLCLYFKAFFCIPFLIALSGCASEYKVIDQNSKYLAELQQEQAYVIGCGDRLRITVWGDDKLTTEPVVRPDGSISFPLIGDIQTKGLTVEDLKRELNRRLTSYINEPSISVAVTDIKSFKIYVLGEVTRQGEFELVSHADVLQGISLAGGFTIYAKKDSIQILRTHGGEKVKFKFNYDQVVRGKNINQNILLKPGDVIIVP